MSEKREQASPTVLGGSITRSPEGRLQTLQTHGMHASPQGVQQVWSSAKRRRYPQAWEGQPLAQVGYLIEWEPRQLACGKCGRSLGHYVAYRTRHPTAGAREEVGLVEDVARERRGQNRNPRYRLEGKALQYAAKTTVYFHCPGCGKDYSRNLARLGAQVFNSANESAFLLE